MPTAPEGGRECSEACSAFANCLLPGGIIALPSISIGITLAALVLYFFTFLGERPTPIFNFLQRLELDALDMRFTYRPVNATPHDPRIVIVDIDQHSQEVLGRWPFSRSNFAKLLDNLKQDNTKTVAFDITFSKPDQSGAAVRELWGELEARKKRSESVDPKLEEQVKDLVAKFDADKQFAASIKNFGAVVLGSYFLYTDADMRGMDDATLDKYAEQLSFFPSRRFGPWIHVRKLASEIASI